MTSMSPNEIIKAAEAYDLAYEGNINDGAVLLGQSIGLIDSIDFLKLLKMLKQQ